MLSCNLNFSVMCQTAVFSISLDQDNKKSVVDVQISVQQTVFACFVFVHLHGES